MTRPQAYLHSWRTRRGYPANWLPLPWRLRLWLCKTTYEAGTAAARRCCRGNKYGDHTPYYNAVRHLGGPCLCERVRRRLDYIPF